MSLDITVKPHYQDYILNKNHKITHDEFEEIVGPDKGDFAYVIHPKQLAKDENLYNNIKEWFSKQEDHLPSFHLTYRQFFILLKMIQQKARDFNHGMNADLNMIGILMQQLISYIKRLS